MDSAFDHFVEEMFNQHFRLPSTGYALVTNPKGDSTMVIEMPGVTKEDLKLHIEEGRLRVEAKREKPSPKDFGSTYNLSRNVDMEKIGAELRDGILTITLPKKESAKIKLIEVK